MNVHGQQLATEAPALAQVSVTPAPMKERLGPVIRLVAAHRQPGDVPDTSEEHQQRGDAPMRLAAKSG
jgi:hypothetical protein